MVPDAIGPLSFERPLVMGVVNVTPDSFSDGGQFLDPATAIAHGKSLCTAGADILDIGGESTRPGAEPVSPEEEIRRVVPVIEGLNELGVPISIDTRHAVVMKAALAAGADIINDVSALSHDSDSMAVAAGSDVPVILMHAQGTPQTMQDDPYYEDVVAEVAAYLQERVKACVAAGIDAKRLILDPGIGFGKTLDHNIALMAGLGELVALGHPVLLGASRKRFIGALTGVEAAENRVSGSVAAALAGIAQGVHIVRVHDVAETCQAIAVWQAIENTREKTS
jgi:dihydropteroate synthase